MPGNKVWSAQELTYLENHYKITHIAVLCAIFDRSKDAIQWKASQLGILQRDGKQRKASYKKIINLTKEHHEFLNKSRNHSHIVRLALDQYIKNHEK